MNNRVVVTGVGVVAPNGLGKEAFWQALTMGLSGVRSIRRFDSEPSTAYIAGEVTELDPLRYFEPHELKKVDRSNVLAVAAALEALADSGLDQGGVHPERIGSSIGNAVCGIEYAQKESDVIYGRGARWGSPYLAIAFFPCGSNGLLSIRLRMKGPVLTFCNGNTSATDAIGMAYRMIRGGRADVMVAGGTEAPLVPLFMGSMARDGWLAASAGDPARASRPFDQEATGMVLAEGAGMVILENEAHARARGARIYAELSAYATANSAFHRINPEPNGFGIERTMKETLAASGSDGTDVDWINAQGFSLPSYDFMEARCMGDCFPDAHQPRVSAISGWMGNPIGALGGWQAVASALALARQTIPVHPMLKQPLVNARLPFARPENSAPPVRRVLQNAYCFMGKSASLLWSAA